MGLLAGIVLVAKPSFIFDNQLTPSQNHSSPTYDTSDLRAEYSNKHYLLYSLRSKNDKACLLWIDIWVTFKNVYFDSLYNFFLIGQLLFLCNDTVSPIAPVPSSIDRDDYYFIGALIALSNAVICAANQILIAKVK